MIEGTEIKKCCANCQLCDLQHYWCNYGFEHIHISLEMADRYCCDHWVKKKNDTGS